MALADILDENIIDLHLKSTTKDEVLHDLSQHLFEAGYIEDIEQFVKDIYIRGSRRHHRNGKPHCDSGMAKAMQVKKIGIAIGRCENEIEWESYDDGADQPGLLILRPATMPDFASTT